MSCPAPCSWPCPWPSSCSRPGRPPGRRHHHHREYERLHGGQKTPSPAAEPQAAPEKSAGTIRTQDGTVITVPKAKVTPRQDGDGGKEKP
jgi:hypothetical protein